MPIKRCHNCMRIFKKNKKQKVMNFRSHGNTIKSTISNWTYSINCSWISNWLAESYGFFLTFSLYSIIFILILKDTYPTIIFYAYHKKSIKIFQSSLNLDNILSLIRAVSLAISANSIFLIHSSIMGKLKSFHLCAHNNLTVVVIYKNKAQFFLPSYLSINPQRNISGL